MQKDTRKPQAKPPVDREAVRVLAIELGAREAARKLGLNENTVLSWARRENWNLPKRTGGPNAIELQSKPSEILIAEHQRLEGQTRTGLSKAAATAATHAGGMQGNEVLSRSNKLRDITHVATKVFGWDKKTGPQTQYNQVVISQEQLDQIRALRASMTEEEKDEIAKRLATPEGQEKIRRVGRELQERAQHMEQPKLPPHAIWLRNLRSDDKRRWQRSENNGRCRGDGSDGETMSDLVSDLVTTALPVNATSGNGETGGAQATVHCFFSSQSFWKAGSERRGSQSGSSLRRAGLPAEILKTFRNFVIQFL